MNDHEWNVMTPEPVGWVEYTVWAICFLITFMTLCALLWVVIYFSTAVLTVVPNPINLAQCHLGDEIACRLLEI